MTNEEVLMKHLNGRLAIRQEELRELEDKIHGVNGAIEELQTLIAQLRNKMIGISSVSCE